MSFANVIGQEGAIRALRGALAAGKTSHAYLFHGPTGTGKTLAALELAKALNCESGGADACDACLSCRRVQHGSHPDLHVLRPGSAKGENISIEQLRQDVIADASLRPVAGRWKVYVIPDADRLSPPAFHTILKVLEEPPPYATIILTAPDLNDLPPTVVSRCQRVRFRPERPGVVASVLRERGVEAERAAFLDAYTEGRVGMALALMEEPSPLERRAAVLDWAQGLPRARRSRCLRLAEDLMRLSASPPKAKGAPGTRDAEPDAVEDEGRAAKGDLETALEALTAWARDALALREAGEDAPIRSVDRRPALREWALAYAPSDLAGILQALLRARYALERNCVPRLVVEMLVFRMVL